MGVGNQIQGGEIMSTYKIIGYRCDFCLVESQNPERWFTVISLPRFMKMKNPDCDNSDIHACDRCGSEIHRVLDILAVPHEYEVAQKEREPFLWGQIVVA
jgi:hypothetical protein